MMLTRIGATAATAAAIAWIALSADEPIAMAIGIVAPAWIALEACWKLFESR